MKTISTYEAKAHFSKILRSVSEGESFIVTRNGDRVAEIRPVSPTRKRKRGMMASTFGPVREDFNEPLEDFNEYQ